MNLKSLLDTEGKDYFYIMHLSYGRNNKREPLWDYAKKKRVIGLDLPNPVNDDWNKIKESVRGKRKLISGNWERQFEIFCNEMKKSDIVVILNGWDSVLGVAKVIEDEYYYDQELIGIFFDHFRKIDWIRKYNFDERLRLQPPLNGFNNTLQKVEQGTKRWKSLVLVEFH